MNVFLWIVAILLAAGTLGAGSLKLVQPKEKLLASGLTWAENWQPWSIKAIGVLEILGALGLILPAALGIAPILTPIAAAGLAIIMIGAIIVHARRNEIPGILPSAILLILAVIVAWGRFGPYSF